MEDWSNYSDHLSKSRPVLWPPLGFIWTCRTRYCHPGTSLSAGVMLTGNSGDVFCNQDETLGKPASNMNGNQAELKQKS